MEPLQTDALDDMNGIYDIAKGLGHLPAMCITYHGVHVHLLEGHFACGQTQLGLGYRQRSLRV